MTKTEVKRNGTITISPMDSGEFKFSVDFDGYQEGSGSPFKTEEEAEEHLKYLLEKKSHYKLNIVDKRVQIIKVKKSPDYSNWEISSENYMVVWTNTGVGVDKRKSDKQRMEETIEQTKKDMEEDGYSNFQIDYYTILPNKSDEEKNEENKGKTSKGNNQKDKKNRSQSPTSEVLKREQFTDDKIREAEEKAEKEFEKALEKISNDKSSDILEELFAIPKNYVKMVALGHSKGLILYGEAGLGKSYNTKKAFVEVGVTPVVMSGHITNLELYQFLYQNKDRHIILDDVNILDNEINRNMLKSALNDDGCVCYSTTSTKLKVPSMFIFEGSITILLNRKPRDNESLKAVESRILVHNLGFEYRNKLKLMKQISLLDYEGLTQEDKDIIFDWIKDNTSEATENFNLRTLNHIFEMYKYDKDEWKKLASKIIINNYEMDLIIRGLNSAKWCEATGKNRATYFRYKNKLK